MPRTLEGVDIVSIDVEGWELEVLRGFSVERYRPKVTIVENVFEEDSYRHALGAPATALATRPPNDVYVPAGTVRMSTSGVRIDCDSRLTVHVSGVTMGDAWLVGAESAGSPVGWTRRGADSAWLPSFGDPPIVSYSQNAEDVRLWRVFRTIEGGFYVDIGAADPGATPSRTSSTSMAGRGSMSSRPVLRGVGERSAARRQPEGRRRGRRGFGLVFLTHPYLGLSTPDPAVHAHVAGSSWRKSRRSKVSQRRLASILEEHVGDRTIHFLKVDVEGAEAQVLASSDWTTFRPMVVVVESIESLSTSRPTSGGRASSWTPATIRGVRRHQSLLRRPGHEELIPILAYPMSALDGFVTAAVTRFATSSSERSRGDGEPAAEPRRRLSVTNLAPRPRPRDGHASHRDVRAHLPRLGCAVTLATTIQEGRA